MLVRAIGLHVGVVVGAVDIISGLEDSGSAMMRDVGGRSCGGEGAAEGDEVDEPCPKPEVGDPLRGMKLFW